MSRRDKNKNVYVTEPLRSMILTVVQAMKDGDYEKARNFLRDAFGLDMESPILYNLLGILNEKQGDYQKASKFYRVSYYMDPTYEAAENNLERISNLFHASFLNVSWGLERLGGDQACKQ